MDCTPLPHFHPLLQSGLFFVYLFIVNYRDLLVYWFPYLLFDNVAHQKFRITYPLFFVFLYKSFAAPNGVFMAFSMFFVFIERFQFIKFFHFQFFLALAKISAIWCILTFTVYNLEFAEKPSFIVFVVPRPSFYVADINESLWFLICVFFFSFLNCLSCSWLIFGFFLLFSRKEPFCISLDFFFSFRGKLGQHQQETAGLPCKLNKIKTLFFIWFPNSESNPCDYSEPATYYWILLFNDR